MYNIVGIENKKGEYEGHAYEHLILYTLSQRKSVVGQAADSFRFSLNRLSPDVRSSLLSLKVGDKIADVFYDKYHKPCGFIK